MQAFNDPTFIGGGSPPPPPADPDEKTLAMVKVNQAYFGWLKFCGCGSPREVLLYVAEVMRLLASWQRSDSYNPLGITEPFVEGEFEKKRAELIGTREEPRYWFFMHVLDEADLIEHGTSAAYSWPTEKGYELLKAVALLTEDEVETALQSSAYHYDNWGL